MSDYNSSLPIRTENDGDVVIKVVDGTLTSQKLTVNADGSVNITDNGGSLTVDAVNLDIRDLSFASDKVDVSGSSVSVSATDLDIRDLSHSQDSVKVGDGTDFLAINNDGSVNAVVSATDLDIRNLVFATDKVDVSGSTVALDSTTLAALESITVQNGAGAAAVNIQDGGNSITVDATDLDIRDLAFATDKVDVSGSSVSVTATDLDIRDLAFATDKVDVSGSNVTVSATDLDIRNLSHTQDSIKVGDGTDFLSVNSDGSINVVVQEDVGTEKYDFLQSSAVAAGASANHDFVVVNGGKLYQVLASGSGKLKCQVQVETAAASGTFNTVSVAFNSTATPNVEQNFAKYVAIPVGAKVRVIMTNKDNQAQDLYSTIILIEN